MPRLRSTPEGMASVDRLPWTTGLSLKSYGVRIGVRSNAPQLLASLGEHLPSGWEQASSPVVDRIYSILVGETGPSAKLKAFSRVYVDSVQLERSRDLEDVLERFQSDLRIFVAEHAKDRVFVHAGVVGWNGKAIVIPGRSYSGKSTLVAALVRAGATYYSDEYAVFDSRGRVHPFAKPLELRDEGEYTQTKVTVAELGGHSGTKPLPVGLVLLTRFKSGSHWRPKRLTSGKGVLELLANTVSARRNPARAFTTLQMVTAKADVLKGVRGDVSEVVSALLAKADQPRRKIA